jgi:hypothetical protein
MKPTLLLSDEAETTRLMLKDIPPVRDTKAHERCNCDRWGHPCPGCVNPDIVPARRLQFHHQSNSEITKWNT